MLQNCLIPLCWYCVQTETFPILPIIKFTLDKKPQLVRRHDRLLRFVSVIQLYNVHIQLDHTSHITHHTSHMNIQESHCHGHSTPLTFPLRQFLCRNYNNCNGEYNSLRAWQWSQSFSHIFVQGIASCIHCGSIKMNNNSLAWYKESMKINWTFSHTCPLY